MAGDGTVWNVPGAIRKWREMMSKDGRRGTTTERWDVDKISHAKANATKERNVVEILESAMQKDILQVCGSVMLQISRSSRYICLHPTATFVRFRTPLLHLACHTSQEKSNCTLTTNTLLLLVSSNALKLTKKLPLHMNLKTLKPRATHRKVATAYPKVPTNIAGTNERRQPLDTAMATAVVGPPTLALEANNMSRRSKPNKRPKRKQSIKWTPT
mmetsp:Transcript_340/g.2697  ORF Transcript_340/g.2697 Transcript_340/m.2697 type:complete len:215 (+) Transcript_340:887-1531(+)